MLLPVVAAIAAGMCVAEAPLTHHSNRLLTIVRGPPDVGQTDDLANHADPLGLIEIPLHTDLERLVPIVTSNKHSAEHPASNLP